MTVLVSYAASEGLYSERLEGKWRPPKGLLWKKFSSLSKKESNSKVEESYTQIWALQEEPSPGLKRKNVFCSSWHP